MSVCASGTLHVSSLSQFPSFFVIFIFHHQCFPRFFRDLFVPYVFMFLPDFIHVRHVHFQYFFVFVIVPWFFVFFVFVMFVFSSFVVNVLGPRAQGKAKTF